MVKQSSPSARDDVARGERFELLAKEILDRCDVLARTSDDPDRLTRTFCSPAMREAHRLVGEWMKAAGMATRVDAAGNLIGTYHPPGCDSERRVLIGSHLDTVVDAGRYDGILGVMVAIAAVEMLRDEGSALPWAVEAIGFSEEEGVRFGAPFIGSRALAGTLDHELLSRTDANGISVAEALRDFGVDSSAVAECQVEPGNVVAYLEPHIEQGPVLESSGDPLAVMTAIAGQTRLWLEWSGRGGHAGTTPMAARVDALPAACRWVALVEEAGRDTPGLVATVGKMEVYPNAPNCIPRHVRISLDVRHQDDAVRRRAVDRLNDAARQLARDAKLEIRIDTVHENAAIAMNGDLTEQLAAAVRSIGCHPHRLVSGAGHDAGVMAAVAPAAMLFIRSPGGVSHHPDEAVTQADVAAALRATATFVEGFARS